jgi:hypothetical protein
MEQFQFYTKNSGIARTNWINDGAFGLSVKQVKSSMVSRRYLPLLAGLPDEYLHRAIIWTTLCFA